MLRTNLYSKLHMEAFDTTKSVAMIITLLYSMDEGVRYNVFSKNTYDSVINILRNKYSHNNVIQSHIRWYIDDEKVPLASSQSKKKRFNQIITEAANENSIVLNEEKKQPLSPEPQKRGIHSVEKDSSNIVVNQLGLNVSNIKLINPRKSLTSIENIKTDYILIDFWADWCAPCLKEILNLKKMQSKYKNSLTIYAISLDNSNRSWLESIERNKCREFSHVYAGNWDTEEAKILINSFEITAIPANFLVNKERKIIAVNLFDSALKKKLEEVIDY